MNIIKKLDKLNKLKELKNIYKLLDLITIEEKNNTVFIKTKKDLVIINEGNTININKGVSVNIAKEIHLNPNIDIDNIIDKPKTLENKLNEAKCIEDTNKTPECE